MLDLVLTEIIIAFTAKKSYVVCENFNVDLCNKCAYM